MKLSPVQKNQILDLASIYAKATQMPHEQMSIKVTGRYDFFDRVVLNLNFADGDPERFIKWMSDHWPRGVVWPDHVPRPASPVVEAA